MKIKLGLIISIFLIYLGLANQTVFADNTIPTDDETTVNQNYCQGATSAILFETSSNKVLFEKEVNSRLSPASMTKIMTLLLIYEALENKAITKEQKLTIELEETKVEGSKAFLSVGEEITVDELLKCICIASANDAAIAMAKAVAGSEAAFVTKMNDKVKELELKDTLFSDCTGLSSTNHYTSAYDLAVIADELVDKYPDVLNYTSIQEDYIRKDSANPFWLVNTNKMIGRVKYLDGLKTGYTSFSKYCISLHMTQNNMSLITVVFGYETATTRNTESLELLRYGFSNYKVDKVVEKDTLVDSFEHILYKGRINSYVKEDIYYLCKKNDENEYKVIYDYNLENGSCDGKVLVYLGDKLIKTGIVYTKEVQEKRNFFEICLALFKKCFQ